MSYKGTAYAITESKKRISDNELMQLANKQLAATLGLIRKMNRESWLMSKSGYDAFEKGCDYIMVNYPEFNQDQIESCVTRAMQTLSNN